MKRCEKGFSMAKCALNILELVASNWDYFMPQQFNNPANPEARTVFNTETQRTRRSTEKFFQDSKILTFSPW
jgi:cysteine synthase